ncbi:hypothetical protein HRI_003367800 [Hibiscus trionum]|uniref:Endonuclease/exonuclease/phosphatase domain-containing protein n=1 Tax=Hibiscus trionum TaxID=183268 RepID=A0A9W7IL53_HIBTR|nr:hypothetical protein HRI_003367800 [Hibiscus trionum]
MNCVFCSWNVRGLGKAEKYRALGKLIGRSKANIVFIQESKVENLKPWVMARLQNLNLRVVAIAPSAGASGGLVSLWNPAVFKVESNIVGARWIILVGQLMVQKRKVALVNVYAPNNLREKRNFFEELSSELEKLSMPLLVGGDFNSVLSCDERIGAGESDSVQGVYSV